MTAIVFSALVWKVIDFLRMLFNFNAQKSAIVTQVTAWVGGVALVLVAAQGDVTKHLVLPGSDQTLGAMDFVSLILIGLLVSSLASGIVDVKQAIDGTDSASKPPMISMGSSTNGKHAPTP